MTAYELADAIEDWETGANYTVSIKAAQMLRQQADRIAELQENYKSACMEIRSLENDVGKLETIKAEYIKATDYWMKLCQEANATIEQQADRIAELEKDLEGCEYFLKAQTNAEPVAWIRSGDDQLSLVKGKDDGYMIWKPLYTTPQTKPLSDEEIKDLHEKTSWWGVSDPVKFARAIEERHGIK